MKAGDIVVWKNWIGEIDQYDTEPPADSVRLLKGGTFSYNAGESIADESDLDSLFNQDNWSMVDEMFLKGYIWAKEVSVVVEGLSLYNLYEAFKGV